MSVPSLATKNEKSVVHWSVVGLALNSIQYVFSQKAERFGWSLPDSKIESSVLLILGLRSPAASQTDGLAEGMCLAAAGI